MSVVWESWSAGALERRVTGALERWTLVQFTGSGGSKYRWVSVGSELLMMRNGENGDHLGPAPRAPPSALRPPPRCWPYSLCRGQKAEWCSECDRRRKQRLMACADRARNEQRRGYVGERARPWAPSYSYSPSHSLAHCVRSSLHSGARRRLVCPPVPVDRLPSRLAPQRSPSGSRASARQAPSSVLQCRSAPFCAAQLFARARQNAGRSPSVCPRKRAGVTGRQ